MTKNADKKREQMLMFCMDDMVPQNHMLRLIDKAIDWTFIYDLVEDKYCLDNGRPSMDPVMLIKIPMIQYLYGIKSMRQTMKEIEVNVAYRWFLGLDMLDPVPHFSTFGKNYTRRFKDTDLFEQIFSKILEDCMKYKLVDTEQIFVDATHVKACANSKKMRKRIAREQTLWYEKELNKEIKKDRIAHDKKPLKDKKPPKPPLSGNGDADHPQDKEDVSEDVKTQKCSITDPESGWFRKGEHKHVFAYAIETACDKHGWILGYSVHPGNEHDSRTFKSLYDKLKGYQPEMIVADAGYKTPAIAHLLLEDEIKPLFPYKRPMTKEGFFKKYEYAYDEYYDCYICPNNKILKYSSDEIFKLISDNVLSGIILFSEFDSFDDSINDIINEPIISEYANQKDIAILIDFVNSYKEFKDIFSFIRQDDYTVCGKYDNIELQESYYVKNDQGKLFYDAKKILSDTEVETFYTAIYPIYEETSILLKFKVSGMKAKEITNAIKNVYDCINKWIAIHSDSKLPISQAIVVSGRLYVDYDITYNEYMKNNISIRNQF